MKTTVDNWSEVTKQIEVVDAGTVAPSMKRYRITWPQDHKTLRVGDVVVMTESPSYDNMLLREPDMTLHRLQDESGQ